MRGGGRGGEGGGENTAHSAEETEVRTVHEWEGDKGGSEGGRIHIFILFLPTSLHFKVRLREPSKKFSNLVYCLCLLSL